MLKNGFAWQKCTRWCFSASLCTSLVLHESTR